MALVQRVPNNWEVHYMISTKSLASTKMPWILAILSLAYISWQLIGIKFQNHDDIYFHLYSHVFSGDYFSFAENTAFKQARVQAFLNMPLILWANGFQGSLFFDAINILVVVCLFVSIIYFFSSLIDRESAILLGAFTAMVFPLHYYFTFPQGYPVMGSYGLIFAFLSAGMLASYLRNPKSVKFIGSVILFTLSLWGPEYNFVLHPLFLLFVFFIIEKRNDFKRLISLGWPYALGWLASIGIYFVFSVLSRDAGGDDYGRVTFAFDLSAWLSTFLVLQEKAFLPAGLIRGIAIRADGVPDIPSTFDYVSLWGAFGSWSSAAIILSIFLILFFLILHIQKLSQKSLLIASAVMLMIAVIPAFIVSASLHYQKIVLNGWLQGHLVTFYSQLGMSGLVFLGCVYAISKTNTKVRILSVFVTSVLLAFYGASTFAYNNANRQVMMANSQKWDAMELVVSYTQTDRPDLADSLFYAPSFWNVNGVSSIPGDSPFSNDNYWTLYSKYVLGKKISFSNEVNKLGDNGVRVEYFPTPEGSPIAVFGEIENSNFSNFILLSSRPIAGTLFNKTNGSRLKEIGRGDWACARYCVMPVEGEIPISDFAVGFQPRSHGSNSLLSQFFIERSSAYGTSLANTNDLSLLKIESWGPRETMVHVVPNPQPDGTSGIWIKLKGGYFQGNLQLMIDDSPAVRTNTHKDLMTASIDPKVFSVAGKKQLTIRNLSNGSNILVGEIEVK